MKNKFLPGVSSTEAKPLRWLWCLQRWEQVGSQAESLHRLDELAGYLLQSDVLLELQGFFCFCFFFLTQEGIIWEFMFPTAGLEVSCKGKLVAAA